MKRTFENQVALVTGAGSGLGLATAQAFAGAGASIAVFGRLDVALNNAGVQNVLAETADSPRDDDDRVMSARPAGTRASLPHGDRFRRTFPERRLLPIQERENQ
ncbi:MAG: short-chain dehydrogenase/reductase [Massilia sp.]|nr:short-chain dehydrogenase/reductase [Massilia sp.]